MITIVKLFPAFLGLMTLLTTGCQLVWPTPKTPTLGVEATGEELWVQTQEHQATVTEKKKVGEVQYKNSNGKTVASSEVFREEEKTIHWTTWYPMQGDLQLDEEDFLRIVGNEPALKVHQDYRAAGKWMNTWGKRLMIGGAATFVVSLFIPAEKITLRLGLSTLGMTAGGGGWYMSWMGASHFEANAHTISPSRANYSIQRYNRSLGQNAKPKATLAIGRSF